MTNFERQILRNQRAILAHVCIQTKYKIIEQEANECCRKTDDLLEREKADGEQS